MVSELTRQLGCKVQALRKNAGMTQEKLAEKCNVSWRTISNLERGLVLPELSLILNLSKQFNISLDELLNNNINTNKSLSRIRRENQIIEEIKFVDDFMLEHLKDYLQLIKKFSE